MSLRATCRLTARAIELLLDAVVQTALDRAPLVVVCEEECAQRVHQTVLRFPVRVVKGASTVGDREGSRRRFRLPPPWDGPAFRSSVGSKLRRSATEPQRGR